MRTLLIAISIVVTLSEGLAQVASPPAATGGASQLIQQARQLIPLGRYPDAVQCLDKALASTTDARQIAEANEIMKQVCTTWLQWLQTTQKQLAPQVNMAEQQVTQAEKVLAEDKKALKAKEDAENKVYVLSTTRYWDYGHWHVRQNTRKGTGDPAARTVINQLQVKTMIASNELSKRAAERDRLQKQLLAVEQYIPMVEGRLQQLGTQVAQVAEKNDVARRQQEAGKLKIIKATFGSTDVTAFVQGAMGADGGTVRASPESFGVSQANVATDKLTIEYSLGEEKKTVTVDHGWMITLPSLKLLPPASAAPPPATVATAPQPAPFVESIPRSTPPATLPPEPPAISENTPQPPELPWYKDWRWIIGGVVVLYVVLRVSMKQS